MRKIHLTSNKIALVDDVDFDKVSAHNWRWLKQKWGGYAITNIGGKTVYMHRLTMKSDHD